MIISKMKLTRTESGNAGVIIIVIIIFALIAVGIWYFFSSMVERGVDEALEKTEHPQLIEIAEEDDSLDILVRKVTSHSEELAKLRKENEKLSLQLNKLSDTKSTIESIFKKKSDG